MNNYAVVVMLPDRPGTLDFASHEFENLTDLTGLLLELEKNVPDWQLVTVCRIELLPKLMEGPPGTTPIAP